MAQESTIITWNVTNWTTVILMALVGFALLAVVQKAYFTWQEKRNQKDAA